MTPDELNFRRIENPLRLCLFNPTIFAQVVLQHLADNANLDIALTSHMTFVGLRPLKVKYGTQP